MAELIKDKSRLNQELYYFTKNEFVSDFFATKTLIIILISFSMFLFLISPVFSLFFVTVALFAFYIKIVKKFLHYKTLIDYYILLFKPKMDKKVLAVVGYEVSPEEVKSHLLIVKDVKKLTEKQKMKEKNRKLWVGIPLNTFRTHFIIPGMTGGGKTELARSMGNDVFKIGGGMIFNDGKSDEKMLIEVATQLKFLNRQTSFRVLNFLKPEKMSETNTINLAGAMHPLKTVNFFATLSGADDPNMDATHKHFVELGKAVLSCGLNNLYIRKELYNEDFDIEKVREVINIKELVVLYFLFYGIVKDLNEIVKENEDITKMIKGFTVAVRNKDFQEISNLLGYIAQNPIERYKIGNILGIQYRYIKELYNNAFISTQQYLQEIWNEYKRFLPILGKALYYYVKMQNKNFFTLNPKERGISVNEFVLEHYEIFKEKIMEETFLETFLSEIGETFDIKFSKYDAGNIKIGLLRSKNSGGNIEEIPDDAVQQHNYALQQWTSLFTTLSKFSHIFGQSKSEITPQKLLLDNQILYNLIPVTEMGETEVKVIGKIALTTINEVASVALGGEKISVHITIKNILKDKNTPKPIYLVFLDEYNSYPISGVDKMLLQYRSLDIGVLIGIQNLAGLKVGGNDETSKENAMANATKIFLKTNDEKTIEWLEKMIKEEKQIEVDKALDWKNEYVLSTSTKKDREKTFDPKDLIDFANGFGLVFGDRIFTFQNFYRGGKTSTIQIPHFVPIDNLLSL